MAWGTGAGTWGSAQAGPDIYQAALVTRDRALQGRQDAIDVLRRTISQLEGNPMAQLLQEKLELIIEHPSVITDEVFNNIMSATNEMLDATYDSETRQFLDTARARGITGPALQSQLQKAKSAKTQALAQAYRDAVIARAQEGRTTQLEAVNQLNNFLSNFFNQKRVLTEDLANVLRSVVEEPYVNPGPPALPQAPSAGGAGGAGAWVPIMGEYPGAPGGSIAERARQRMEEDIAKMRERYLGTGPLGARGEEGRNIMGVSTQAQADQLAQQQKQIEQLQAAQPSATVALPESVPGTGYVETAGGGGRLSAEDLQSQLQEQATQAIQRTMPQPLPSGAESAEAMAGRIAQYGSMEPGVQVQNVRLPMGGTVSSYAEPTARGGVESSLQLPGQQQPLVYGGGVQETQRVVGELLPKYGAEALIGTSEGAGVRTGTVMPASATYDPRKNQQQNLLAWQEFLKRARASGDPKLMAVTMTEFMGGGTSGTPTTRKGQALVNKLRDEGGGAGTVIETSEGFGVRK